MLAALEAGGTKMVLALGNSPTELLARHEIPTTDPETTHSALLDALRTMEAATGQKIEALGVASFGPLQIKEEAANYGEILSTPKPGWTGFNFPSRFQSLDSPIRVDTDVNAAALAAWSHGAGKGLGTVAYVTVGTGIGVGIVDHGEAISGFGHYEIGHIYTPLHADDPFPGTCPFHGDCLEGMASGPAIQKRWGKDLSSIAINATAIDIQAHYLAHLAHSLLLMHAPEKIIFGGGVMQTQGLMNAVRRKAAQLLNGYLEHPCLSNGMTSFISEPGLGKNSGITGALMLAERSAKQVE